MAASDDGGSARSISRDSIVETALRIADTRGLENLTIRAISAELGIGTMSLYSHFRSKDELLDGIADHVLGRFELPEPGLDETPERAIREIADAWRVTMRRHPCIVQMLLSRVSDGRDAMNRALEAPLARLVNSGIPPELAVKCYGFLIVSAIGFFSYQHPRPWGRDDTGERDELRRQRQHFYSSLPIPDFPVLVELSSLAVDLPSDDQYDFGVECLVQLVAREVNQPSH